MKKARTFIVLPLGVCILAGCATIEKKTSNPKVIVKMTCIEAKEAENAALNKVFEAELKKNGRFDMAVAGQCDFHIENIFYDCSSGKVYAGFLSEAKTGLIVSGSAGFVSDPEAEVRSAALAAKPVYITSERKVTVALNDFRGTGCDMEAKSISVLMLNELLKTGECGILSLNKFGENEKKPNNIVEGMLEKKEEKDGSGYILYLRGFNPETEGKLRIYMISMASLEREDLEESAKLAALWVLRKNKKNSELQQK